MSRVVILVTGSRSITDESKIWEKLYTIKTSLLPHTIIALVEGDAEGVDKFCGRWAKQAGIAVHECPVKPEDWDKYGSGAGHVRNLAMLNYANEFCKLKDALLHCVAFWDGSSTGTEHMIKSMKKDGNHVEVHLMGKPKTKRLI